MRMIIASMFALGVVGAAILGDADTAKAQGFYFNGPGVTFGLGSPWYYDRYRGYYYEPYYYYGRPYWRYRHHYRWRD